MTRFKDYAQDLVRASDLRPSTARTYESALRVHIYPFFGHHDIEDVTPTVVRAFIAQQLNDGIGSGAMNLCYRLLSKIMHAALADELIQRNPLNAVKPPRIVASSMTRRRAMRSAQSRCASRPTTARCC
jgi:site-specific recombinase XerC